MGFGYCLARDTWGHGIATEAARAFVASVLENPAICRIQAYCDVENRASARVLEKVGLELEGTLRQYLVLPNLGESPVRRVLLRQGSRWSGEPGFEGSLTWHVAVSRGVASPLPLMAIECRGCGRRFEIDEIVDVSTDWGASELSVRKVNFHG